MKKRILYVEDNEDNVYMLSRRLERKGYLVDIALTGEEGVAAALSNPPDMILMDLSLPGIDGWEAISLIRAQSNIPFPIIVLSAHAMESHIAQSLAAGATDFESKPIDFKGLMEKIHRYIGEPQ